MLGAKITLTGPILLPNLAKRAVGCVSSGSKKHPRRTPGGRESRLNPPAVSSILERALKVRPHYAADAEHLALPQTRKHANAHNRTDGHFSSHASSSRINCGLNRSAIRTGYQFDPRVIRLWELLASGHSASPSQGSLMTRAFLYGLKPI